MTQKCVHVLVSGRVQGVFYRESLRRRVAQLGVSGWVKNLTDGRVEAVFEGEEEAVRRAVDYARDGPPFAHVSELRATAEPVSGERGPFEVRH